MNDSNIAIIEFIAILLVAVFALRHIQINTNKTFGEYSTEKKINLVVNIRKRKSMKISSNLLATIAGSVSGVFQLLGQAGVVNPDLAKSISAIAVIVLGIVSNNNASSTPGR